MTQKDIISNISKHPLIELLKKDKFLSYKQIASIIAEELIKIEAQSAELKSALAGLRRDFSSGNTDKYINSDKKAIYPYSKLGEMTDEEQKIYKDRVDKKVAEFLQQSSNEFNPIGQQIKAIAQQQKSQLGMESTPVGYITKNLDKFPGFEENFLKGEDVPSKEIALDIFLAYISLDYDETLLEQNKDTFINYLSNDFGIQEVYVKQMLNKMKNRQVLDTFIKLMGDKDKRNLIISYAKVFKPGIKAVVDTSNAPEGQKNLDKPTSEPEPTSEPTSEPETEPEQEKFQFTDQQKKKFISAANEFEQEFYNKKLLLDQAKLIKSVLDSMKELQQNPNLAQAFGRVPTNEQQEKVKADEDELRNLRVDFRSFLQRVNKSTKTLAAFEEAAEKGRAISDKYKNDFMNILKNLQKSIKRIVLNLQKILPKEEELTEIKETPIVKKWSEVQNRYNKAVQNINGLKELLSGQATDENPSEVINDTFKSLIDLSQDFPSVNPFNIGVKTAEDFSSYKESFKSAVAGVKSSLQNVLSLIKSSIGGEESLRLAMDGLKEFSGQIQNIFGVKSEFKRLQIDSKEQAAQPQETSSINKSDTITKEPEDTGTDDTDTSQVQSKIEKQIKKTEKSIDLSPKKSFDKIEKLVITDISDEEKKVASQALETFYEKFKENYKSLIEKSKKTTNENIFNIKNKLQKNKIAIEALDETINSFEKSYMEQFELSRKDGNTDEQKKKYISSGKLLKRQYQTLMALFARKIQGQDYFKIVLKHLNRIISQLDRVSKLNDILADLDAAIISNDEALKDLEKISFEDDEGREKEKKKNIITQADMAKRFYTGGDPMFRENYIASKLTPLIGKILKKERIK